MSDTDFWITPAGLEQQAGGFEAYADTMSSAKTWVQNHPVGDSSGHPLYQGAASQAQEITDGLITFFSHVAAALDSVGVELRSVAAEASTMDMQTAAEMDALDPTEYNDYDPNAPGSRGAAELAPSWDRTDEAIYTVNSMPGGGIGYYCAADGQFDYVNDRETNLLPADLLSPTQWLWTVAGWIGASSIKDDLIKIFGGLWVDLYEFQYMLKGLGTMLEDVAGNVEACAGALSVYWQGYSANSAQEYFTDLSSKLREAGTQMTFTGEQFYAFLSGVESEFDALSSAAHSFLDALIVAAAAAGVGTATIETGVGAVAGYGVAGLALLWASSRANKVWSGIQTALTLLDVLKAVDGISSDLSNITSTLHIPVMEETA